MVYLDQSHIELTSLAKKLLPESKLYMPTKYTKVIYETKKIRPVILEEADNIQRNMNDILGDLERTSHRANQCFKRISK